MNFYLKQIDLPLKVNWKLSRNETNHKTNFYVVLESDEGEFVGEVAPNIRYGETPERIMKEFEAIGTIGNIQDFVLDILPTLNISASLKFGIESCFVSLLASRNHQKIYEYLQVPKPAKRVATSYSLPIMPIGDVADYLKKIEDFHFLKIKVDHECAKDLIFEVINKSKSKIRIDANEGFSDLDEFMKLEKELRSFSERIEFIEEPFPTSELDMYKHVKSNSDFVYMADESTLEFDSMKECSKYFDAINVKLMKSGSFYSSLQMIEEAKKYDLQVMLGCMIETSVGISYAFELNRLADYFDLDGFLLIKDDPFERLVCQNGFVGY